MVAPVLKIGDVLGSKPNDVAGIFDTTGILDKVKVGEATQFIQNYYQ